MNQKSLSVKNKNHKKILIYLKDKKILKIFKEFESKINTRDKLAVAVSGGPDSLSLAFLARCFSLKHNIEVKYFIVDHKLRKESSSEAKIVNKVLKKKGIICKILKWNGKKPTSNIQSIARTKRYSLLIKACKKFKINNILLGHHLDDLFENFLLRILRGSGLNGLISLDQKAIYKDVKILRPLLDLEKKHLTYLSKKIFNFFIEDSSNKNENFKRIRIRKLLNSLKQEGLDKKKFLLTIKNLKDSNRSVEFYVNRNLKKNSIYLKKENKIILKKDFFDQSHDVVFRSLTKIIQLVGKKYYPVRGKSISGLINRIKLCSHIKVTLGSCFIEKINETILISKEN